MTHDAERQPAGAPVSAAGSREIELVRGGWGLLLLVAPRQVMRAADVRVDGSSLMVGRLLGARHLTQAALSGLRPSPEVLAMGTWVDAVHAISALALAVADRNRLRPGLLDAAIAAVWAGAGYRDLAGALPTADPHRQLGNRPFSSPSRSR